MKDYLEHIPQKKGTFYDSEFLNEILNTTDVLIKQDELDKLRRENSEYKRINSLQKHEIDEKIKELRSRDEIVQAVCTERGISDIKTILSEISNVLLLNYQNQYKEMYQSMKIDLTGKIEKIENDLNIQIQQ